MSWTTGNRHKSGSSPSLKYTVEIRSRVPSLTTLLPLKNFHSLNDGWLNDVKIHKKYKKWISDGHFNIFTLKFFYELTFKPEASRFFL